MDQNAQPIEDAEYEDVEDTSEELQGDFEEYDSEQPAAQDDIEVDETNDEAEEADEEGLQELEFSDLNDFAEALDVDVDTLLDKIQTKVKVNGQEIPVTLKELHSGYQKDADYRQKTSEIAETRRQFENIVDNLNTQYTQRIQEIDALASSLEQSYMEDYESIDWNKLRREDPANFAILKQDMEDRKQHIANAKLKVHMERENQAQEIQNYIIQNVVPQEMRKLAEYNPSWADQKQWSQDYNSMMTNLVQSYGFSPEEVATVYDSRMLKLAWDVLQYNTSKSNRENGVKEIKKEIASKKQKLSKVLKPGANKPRISGKGKRIKAAQQRLKSSGSVDDAAALILERMNSR